jgi:ketosteroid isomerase-like protein
MPHADSLRAAYAAFTAGDLPGILAPLDEQIEWHVPTVLPQGGDYHGHDGVVRYLRALAEHLRDPHVDVDAVLENGNRVMVTGRVTAADTSYGFAHSWLFGEERAIEFREYVD